MNKYNVEIARETLVVFEGVEAATPEAAVAIADDQRPDAADLWVDCDEGDSFDARVDLVGDAGITQTVHIDLLGGKQRNAGPMLVRALEDLLKQLIAAGIAPESPADAGSDVGQREDCRSLSFARARAALIEARDLGIIGASPLIPARPRFTLNHDPNASPEQAKVFVDGRFYLKITCNDAGFVSDVYQLGRFQPVATMSFWQEPDQELGWTDEL